MNSAEIFRPKGNLAWGYSALALDLLFIVQAVFYGETGDNVFVDLTLAALIAAVAILIWLRPKLVLKADHLVVVNPLSTKTIAYNSIIGIETKWALLLKHSGRTTRVWVAPANGKTRWITDSTQNWRFRKLSKTRAQTSLVEVTSISASHNSDSGVAARLIQERIDSLH
ncbi:MAG: hypothetical protein RL196_234 [Actinomycetota bacterium]|jgi:hypothetical protein